MSETERRQDEESKLPEYNALPQFDDKTILALVDLIFAQKNRRVLPS